MTRPVTAHDLEVRRFERDAYAQLDRIDSSSLDIGLLIASGAMQPPKVGPQPLTITLRQRIARWWRAHVVGGPECGERFR